MKLDHHLLLSWFNKNYRKLPWRVNKDPYRVWISEIMLQQTTVATVAPFYERFLYKFPTVNDLASAKLSSVIEMWAGLGYYSRARNLHAAAKEISKNGFPTKAEDLIKLPGFGPYTSRAVASISFKEPVGVLDGNVIRVLTRRYGLKTAWWTTDEKRKLQNISDEFAKLGHPDRINQALMELGATICTPRNPTCLICPWMKNCSSASNGWINQIPLKKTKRSKEIWAWYPQILVNKNKVGMVPNKQAPFLKDSLIFPGEFKKLDSKPQNYQAQHSITHHSIYIVHPNKITAKNSNCSLWVNIDEIKTINPSSMLQKAIETHPQFKFLHTQDQRGL